MPKISEDLIGHTTFATSEERRFDFLIGRTEFVTIVKRAIEGSGKDFGKSMKNRVLTFPATWVASIKIQQDN
jgi:hypothetical protein